MVQGIRQRDDEAGLLARLREASPALLEGLSNPRGARPVEAAAGLERARAMLLGLVGGALAWAHRLEPELAAAQVQALRGELSAGEGAWSCLLAWLRPARVMDEELVPAEAWRAPPEPGWGRALLDILLPEARGARAGVAELAAAPRELLGELYEHTLGYRAQREQGRVSLRPWALERKGGGRFYTPARLAEPTVRRVLEPALRGASSPERVLELKICDPAMGGGSLLLASLRALGRALAAARGQTDARASTRAYGEVLGACIYGVDRDPLAVALARAALWLEAGAPEPGPREACPGLRCGDALIGAWPSTAGRYPLAALDRPVEDRAARKALRAARAQAQAQTDEPGPRPSADSWCALWFWPSAQLELLPSPRELAAPGEQAVEIVAQLVRELRMFHWHERFPEVFARGGFDAVITNPPWDIHKPSSKEFFSGHDPDYRAYSKQDALRVQAELFERDPSIELRWRARLRAFADRAHFLRTCFVHQGRADLNAYKLFVELAYRLTRTGGQLGLIVPSGLYTDQGAVALRELLLRRCRWRWLYGFENRRRLFEIDGRFKFCVVIAQVGQGESEPGPLRAAFMRHSFEDWDAGAGVLAFPLAWISELSPRSQTIVELRSQGELELLRTIHAGAVTLGAEPDQPGSWAIRYARELDMTNDSARFSTRAEAEAMGLSPDAYGDWRGAGLERHVPVYEGRMIEQFDFSAKGWVRGRGRQARWRELDWADKGIEPQFLVPASVLDSCSRKHGGAPGDTKLCFMAIGSATNRRSMFAALVRGAACGNAVPVLRPRGGLVASLALAAVLDSFVYDFALRARLGGLNLNRFVISETALPPATDIPAPLVVAAARLSLVHPRFAPAWLELLERYPQLEARAPGWALTQHERLRLRCMVDAMVAALYGLSALQLRFVLRDCDHEVEALARRSFSARLDPKGLWRVDRSRPPQLRHSVLTLHAHDALQAAIAGAGGRVGPGIEAFAGGLSCEGWQLPAQLSLAALALTRARASAPAARQPRRVAPALGPRWLPWQLAQTPAQAWARCRAHATELSGLR